jgi:DNA-binding CsgD family transcriptional regulator
VYLRGLAFEQSESDWFYLQAAEEWLARTMRGPIRVPAWLQEYSTEARQRSVGELAAEGLTAGQIARILRLPKQKVRRLLSDRAARLPVAAHMPALGVRSESAMNQFSF